MRKVRNVAICLAVLACAAQTAVLAEGPESEVVLTLRSGRQFRGQIDGASTAEELVLRTTRGGITLWRPIRFERIERAEVDGRAVEVARLKGSGFRSQVSGIRSQGRIEIHSLTAALDAAAEPRQVEGPLRSVAMAAFDAHIANWDADVETDGLVVDIMPLDIDRYLVPASGTLEVELYAPQRRTLDLAPMSGGDTLELVERWNRAIAPEDFGPSGVRLRLPFGAIHPELRPDWTASWYGLVHVRLAIPGQGVFEDSRDGVRIRPWAPNRDQLEMNTGQRFLSTENLGRRD